MPRPSFQFYPGDWMRNANLRRCTPAEQGAWINVICLLHDSEQYGLLRWPLKDIAQAISMPISCVRGLVQKNVLKGCDKGTCPDVIFVPKTANKKNDPVVLMPECEGPVWYSHRMLRDEYVRNVRANHGANQAPLSGVTKPPLKSELCRNYPANSKQQPNQEVGNKNLVTTGGNPW